MRDIIHIAILSSGEGTNAENIINFAKEETNNFCVDCVLTDNQNAGVIHRCDAYKVPIHIVPRQEKKLHEKTIVQILKHYPVNILCLAGFTRILSKWFLEQLDNVLNIHPSFLPEFPGLKAFERAFESKQSYSGITVHYVDEGIDTGKIIVQEKFYRTPEDTFESFKEKGKALEKKLYPQALLMMKEFMR